MGSTALPAAASSTDPGSLGGAAQFNEFVYAPLHAAEQAWITSPIGEQVDNAIITASG
jgi:hypothetical protein